jgi:hypothetical protein
MKTSRRALRIGQCGLILAVLAILGGCSDGRPKRVRVSGTVTIDGKPLAGGALRLIPQHGRPAVSPIDPSGHFQLSTYDPDDGAVPGTFAVEVLAYDNVSPGTFRWRVPRKYEHAKTSGMTVTISERTDDLAVELKSAGQQPDAEKIERHFSRETGAANQ